MPDQFEQYYKYLKANGADVAPDFNSFKSTLSDYNNASKYYSYLKENQFDVPATYDSFADTFGLKKKVGGAESSPTGLPLQGFSQKQIELLQKGVEKPIQAVSQKKSSGLVVPTNLPKQEALAYENELKLNDVAVNTLKDIYIKKGLKFDPSKPASKKQIQEYVDKSINGDLTKVTGKDGKEYLVRSQGFLESGKNSFVRSLTEPVESTKINFTDSPEELADLLDEKIKQEPNVPEAAPSDVTGYLGGLAGGLPKLAALTAIPYVGEAAMVGEMYYNALANQRRTLYQRGLQEGMDRVSAAKKAMEIAPLSAIPDALVAAVMAKGVGGKGGSIIPNSAKESFAKAIGNTLKGVAGVSAIGGYSEYERSKIQQRAGYKVTDAEAIENGFKGAGDYAIMDAAFKAVHAGPKYLSSAAKNLLSTVHPEVIKVVAEKYPDGKETIDEISKFTETKSKVQDFVPEEKVASVTGLTEKTDNLKSSISDLEEKKKGVTQAIAKEIDLEIADKNKEIKFYDNQIKKVIESKDETGISEEVDDVTGLKAGEEIVPKVEKPSIEQQAKESIDGNLVTFTYKSEAEVPEVFKDRISSTAENTLPDGTVEKFVRVTVPKSLADYELGKVEQPKKEVKPTEVKKPSAEQQAKELELDQLMPLYAQARKTMMKKGDEFLGAEERDILADPVKYLQEGVENNKFNINNLEKQLAESTPEELEKTYSSTGLSKKEYIKNRIKELKDGIPVIEDLIKKVDDVIKKPSEVEPTEVKISETEINKTADALKSFDKIIKGTKTAGTEVYNKAVDLIKEKKTHEFSGKGWEDVAEAYHKALNSGKNPELVKLIDSALGKEIKKSEVKQPAKELVEGEEVSFKTPEGSKVTGEKVEVPGYEDMDLVLVRDGFENRIYELSSGLEIGGTQEAFSKEAAIESLRKQLEERKITSEKIHNVIFKGEKVKQINPSNKFESYAENRTAREKADYESLPLKFTPKEIAELQELKKKATEYGIDKKVKEIEDAISSRAKEGTFKPSTEYFEKILQTEIDRKIKKESEQNKVPYPKEYIKESPKVTEDYLKKMVNSGFKVDKFSKIPSDVKEMMIDGLQLSRDFLNKYGYHPYEQSDNFFTKLLYFMNSIGARENKEARAIEARKELISALDNLRKVHEKEFGKGKEEVKVYSKKDLEKLTNDENYEGFWITFKNLKENNINNVKEGDIIDFKGRKYLVNRLENKNGYDVYLLEVDNNGNAIRKKDLELKVYNAEDLKKDNNIIRYDIAQYSIGYPESFSGLYTDMFSMKRGGYENPKIGDVVNIFKKDYVVAGFIENKKNPDKTSVKLIRVDKDGNILREQDLSKKERKEGKAKEFEEEEVEIEQPETKKPKEEKIFAQKDLDRAEAKRIHSRVSEMEPPSDAEQVALRYLAEGGKVSQDAINEVSGTTKRASLNTGRRELKTAEAKARDYAGGTESLDDLAHRLWEASGQEISERDIKDALMSEIGNNNTRLDASKAYLERYNAEYNIEQEEIRVAEQNAEMYLEEQNALEKELRKELDEQIEGESSEEHVNNLINQYEAESKAENQQLRSEGKGEANKEVSKGEVTEKAPETELAKEYKEAINKASKKAKENAKKEFVDRNFENLVEKLKIQIKCPT